MTNTSLLFWITELRMGCRRRVSSGKSGQSPVEFGTHEAHCLQSSLVFELTVWKLQKSRVQKFKYISLKLLILTSVVAVDRWSVALLTFSILKSTELALHLRPGGGSRGGLTPHTWNSVRSKGSLTCSHHRVDHTGPPIYFPSSGRVWEGVRGSLVAMHAHREGILPL